MSAPHLWPRFVGRDDNKTLIGCPNCAEGLMRWTDTQSDRGGTVMRFVCMNCETLGELDVHTGSKKQTSIEWRWERR